MPCSFGAYLRQSNTNSPGLCPTRPISSCFFIWLCQSIEVGSERRLAPSRTFREIFVQCGACQKPETLVLWLLNTLVSCSLKWKSIGLRYSYQTPACFDRRQIVNLRIRSLKRILLSGRSLTNSSFKPRCLCILA